MPLETATFTSQLVSSNPVPTDGLFQADDHMRLIKGAIQATFPNFTAVALASTQAQLDAAVASVVTGTAAGRFLAGTAALPGLTPIGDTNTGIYAPAADTLALALNGVNAATFAVAGSSFAAPLSAPAVASTGAFSGGTGQLVPIGGTLIWWDDVLPAEGGYVWCNGVPILRANFPTLFARWGTRYGPGDGSTTFGIPDLRDTAPVGKSTMGAAASRALQTLANTVLNALFGEANHATTLAEMPAHSHSGTTGGQSNTHTHATDGYNAGSGNAGGSAGGFISPGSQTSGAASADHTHNFTTDVKGSGTAHNVVQPSTTCNYILRAA